VYTGAVNTASEHGCPKSHLCLRAVSTAREQDPWTGSL